MTSSVRRAAAAVLVGVGLALLLAQTLPAPACLQDDAFISLRYARHLAEGEGLVYNPGERVEGFTNFLWTVTLGLPFAAGLPAESFARWLGVTSGLCAVLAGAWLASRLYRDRLAGGFAAAFIGAMPWLAAESVMGLETMGFAALATAGLALHQREERSAHASGASSGTVLALASLTRPEGCLIAGLTGLADLSRGVWRNARFWRRWISFAVPTVGLLVFRIVYYGDLVPNTFHAKVGGGLETVERGLSNAGYFVLSALPILLLALAGTVRLWRHEGEPGWRRGLLALHPAGVLAAYGLYVVMVGGDFKPTLRFFAVPSILAAVHAGGFLAGWITGIAAPARRALPLGIAALGIAWALTAGGASRDFVERRARQIPVHRAAGLFLGERLPSSAWIATGNAGLIPYASRLPTLDMVGLCDAHIAARDVEGLGHAIAGHGKGDGNYVLRREPRVILFQQARFSERPLQPDEVGGLLFSLSERELWNDERFHRRYRLVSERLPGFYFNYFVRRQGPAPG